MAHKYTDEEIEFLKVHYPIGDWDGIFQKMPDVTKSSIHCKMHKMGIKFDIHYKKKLSSADVANRTKWTQDEIAIVRDNYSNVPMEVMLNLLPNRSADAIHAKAAKEKIPSYRHLQERYTDEQRQFIKDNYELMPDELMARELGKNRRSVQGQRLVLGLYRRDMESLSYPTLSKYLRGQNWRWKSESMASCNYCCVLTGSKNFEIHHLYGVSNIIEDLFKQFPEMRRESFEDYSSEELSFILQQFLELQGQYPLGECVDKQLHILFHSMYGQYYNTPAQWYRFKEDYMKGLYNDFV